VAGVVAVVVALIGAALALHYLPNNTATPQPMRTANADDYHETMVTAAEVA
jgi:hypothetical protein